MCLYDAACESGVWVNCDWVMGVVERVRMCCSEIFAYYSFAVRHIPYLRGWRWRHGLVWPLLDCGQGGKIFLFDWKDVVCEYISSLYRLSERIGRYSSSTSRASRRWKAKVGRDGHVFTSLRHPPSPSPTNTDPSRSGSHTGATETVKYNSSIRKFNSLA